MRLGQQVLSKIQNLLTHFEESPPKQKVYTSPPKKNGQPYIKLYEDHKALIKKQEDHQKMKVLQEVKQNVPFKITNRHTIFLNSQKQQAPLYKRLDKLQQHKEQEMKRLRDKHTPNKDTADLNSLRQEQIEQEMEERRRNERKYTQEEADRKHKELMQKERMRVERLNMVRLKTIESHTKQFRRKPYVRKQTQDVWNRYRLRKQLSSSVFGRFEQYEMDRRTHLEEVEKEVKKTLTPFAPRISDQSRLLASRSTSRTNLNMGLSRSSSCKCIQKSRARKNNNYLATMHSTRQAF